MKILRKLALLAVALSLSQAAFAFQPRNVLCIAPSDPGGGWDFTCRTMASLLSDLDLVQGRVRTQNMPGAGGGVAYAHVVGQQKGNANLLVAASTATTSRLALGQFQGFDADDVRWLAALGADYGVIGVAPDSPYQTLGDLIAALEADPASIRFVGGSAVGGWDHLKILLLADAAGVADVGKIRYTSFSSGGPAVIEILGGRADAFSGDVSETLAQVEAGNLKVIAVLGDDRVGGLLEDVPTAKEQGVDVVGANWRGFYLAPEVGEEEYAYWVDAMAKLEQSDEFATVLEQNGLARFWRSGADMEAFVADQVEDIQRLAAQVTP